MIYDHLVGFGEAMLRLSVPPGGSLETAAGFQADIGGAELNGCIAAARCGMPAVWISAVPDTALGRSVLRHARANDVSPMNVAGDARTQRLGVYFLEMAVPPRPHRIVYDRAGSVFAGIGGEDVTWPDHLGPTSCLYISGITPPLGAGPRAALTRAIATAREASATIALDVNYRSTLWQRDDARSWLRSVIDDVDILSAGTDDLAGMGLDGPDPHAAALQTFGLRAIMTTRKQQHGSQMHLEIRGLSVDEEATGEVTATVVDPLGAGDAMFGTFVARLPVVGLHAAVDAAIGAAVSSYGLAGDALTVDRWHATDEQGVVR